jgi:hypothetical protein
MNDDELKAAAFRRAEYLRWLADGIGDDGAFDWYEGAVDELDKQILSAWAIDRIAADEAERAEREKPIDEEWLRSIGWRYRVSRSGEKSLCHRLEQLWGDDHWIEWDSRAPVLCRLINDGDYPLVSWVGLPQINTRGQLLDLLRALGVGVKK